MTKWWPFRQKQDAQTFEKELASIASRIAKCQQKQLKYNLQQRRAKGVLTLYGVLVYSIYSVIVFSRSRYLDPRHITALLGVPVGIYVIRYVIQSWFNWLGNANDELLKSLKTEQEKKIEDLKQQTNFYSTQALLDRYDESPSRIAHPPPRKNVKPASVSSPSPGSPAPNDKQQLSSSMAPPPGMSKEFTFNSPVKLDENGPSPNLQHMQPPPQLEAVHVVPYQPKWYDRVLDLIAGEDEYSPRARYALICSNCQHHNGLAPPGETPEFTIYLCPHCGTTNGKPKNKRKEEVELQDEIKTDSDSDPLPVPVPVPEHDEESEKELKENDNELTHRNKRIKQSSE